MIKALRRRHPGAPLWRIFFWYAMHFLCYLWFVPAYRYRAWGATRIPQEGPLLIISNHQSFFDPILVGLAGHKRQFYAMARSTLFDHAGLAWMIRMLNAVPVERGSGDMGAIRKCLGVLQDNQALLIFPEGTRTTTGQTRPFETGTMLLIKRAKPTILPVAVEGAHRLWPRDRSLPKASGQVGVMYGEPIPAEQLLAMKPDEALEHLRLQVETMRQDVARRLARG